MGWSVSVELDGLNWKCDTLADTAADLEVPLRILGAHLKKKALARYKAQAFAPLAQATIEKRALGGLRSLEHKLKRDVRRAFKRARLARGPARGGLLQQIFSSAAARHAADDALGQSTRGVQNRLAVLSAFHQRHGKHLGLKELAEGRALTLKQQQSLDEREARAIGKAIGRPILGGLDKTLVVEVEHGAVTLRSATHQEWSEAHNAGATVGHGAKLPQRQTVKLEQDDIDFFLSVLKGHLLVAFDHSMHGPGF